MIGENITNIRKAKKMSQEKLAEVLNTSRQAVSKWERGETYPDIDKIKDIATFFDVSIDYLLDFDLTSVSVNNFIERTEKCVEERKFDITEEEIRMIASKNRNNFTLLFAISGYLVEWWAVEPSDHIADLIIEFGKKALDVYREGVIKEVTKTRVQKIIVLGYTLKNQYAEAKEYINDNNVSDSELQLAECEYELGNYNSVLEVLSKTFLSSISDIINGNIIQARLLVRIGKVKDAYDISKWSISFINSIGKKDDLLIEIVYIFTLFKAFCEKNLGLDYKDSYEFLLDNKNKIKNIKDNTDEIKFYYDKREDLTSIVGDIPKEIYREIKGLKDKALYNDAMFIYNKLFGEEEHE